MSDELDLEMLSESFTEFLAGEWPIEKATAHHLEGRDPLATELWSAMAELGWQALGIDEAHGGLGMGLDGNLAGIVALHTAIGAHVAPVPMLGTTLAAALLAEAASEAQKDRWLPGLADGSLRAAVTQPDSPALSFEGSTISGTVADLIDGGAANLFVIAAQRGGKPVWVLVEADAPGVAVTPTPLADGTHSMATITLDNVSPADDAVLAPADPRGVSRTIKRHAAVAIAADALGGGNAILGITVAFMKERQQFGVPIGSFQALKHRAADHKANLVAARALLDAAAAMEPTDPQAVLFAISAKAHITRIAAEVARDCLQLHGGVGFTSEYPPHLFLKRAKLNEYRFGTRAQLLDLVADELEAA